MSTRPIIRVSDTNLFKTCRTKWDFASKIRMGYELTRGIEPLDFGSAIHEAMEVIYDPDRWNQPRDVVYAEAQLAFSNWMHDWKKRMIFVQVFENERERWEELLVMGIGMIKHYKDYSEEMDHEWKPVRAEISFEIPIPVSNRMRKHVERIDDWRALLHTDDGVYYLYKWNSNIGKWGEWEKVLFQGRIDTLMEHLPTKKLWMWDHKTAKTLPEMLAYLDFDGQASGYAFAARELGIHVDGIIFNQLRKKAPEQPLVLKDGRLSKDKSQNTTKEMYRKKIKERKLNPDDYEEFLSTFVGQKYFRRPQTFRSQDELDSFGDELVMMAIDMLGDPFIYRTPSTFQCNTCQFSEACKMRADNSDWKWFLEHSGHYTKRN